jgi:hypothetical protein
MKLKPFKIEVEKPKARKKAVPPTKVIKDKKSYSRKQKYALTFLEWGYEL